eukprot:850758_1
MTCSLFTTVYESKLLAKVYAIGVLVFFLCFLVAGSMRNVYPNSYEWVLRVNSFVLPSYVAMSIYPSTMMIVNKNKLDETQLVSMVGSSSMGRSDGKATRNNLVSMMSNREALHLFALHLSREYSLEILL